MTDDDENNTGSPRDHIASSFAQRACQNCRIRKIRCDRNSPCSHCSRSGIPCTPATPRPKVKRPRVLLSTQYERKIDIIDDRLQEVTQLLRGLRAHEPRELSQPLQVQENTKKTAPYQQPSAASTPFGHVTQSASDSPVVEGESSLASHSLFANDYLRNAISTRTHSQQDPGLQMDEILDSLQQIVNGMKQQTAATEMAYPNAVPALRSSLGDCQLPPIERTVTLVRDHRPDSSPAITWMHELCPTEFFSSLCLSIYFSKDFSHAEFIITNAGLMYLFQDHAARVPDERTESLSFAQMCRVNLETALGNLPFHLPANKSMIFALVIGSLYAIEVSKPSISWTLTSRASELCQTLGFHQPPSDTSHSPTDIRQQQLLFWCVYCLDKGLSLRLGRASMIPDWGIGIPIPKIGDFHSSPLLAVISLSIPTARCQGSIYEMLYSPASFNQPDHVRKSRADSLAGKLNEIRANAADINLKWIDAASRKIGSEFANFIALSDDVVCLSLLTLVYRASPPLAGCSTPFIPECVEAARTTLQRHQDCMALIGDTHSVLFPIYMNWTLLFTPFIPFIVLFCQAIDTQEQTDLDCLRRFTSSMECAPAVSEAAAKMLRLFQVLDRVANRYVEACASAPSTDDMQTAAELNMYIADLGLPVSLPDRHQQPNELSNDQGEDSRLWARNGSTMAESTEQTVADQRNWVGNTTQLQEWFNSNHQMMGLIEDPSFAFDT